MMLLCSEFENESEEGCNETVWYAVSWFITNEVGDGVVTATCW